MHLHNAKQKKGHAMKSLMNLTTKAITGITLALGLAIASLQPAFAIENKSECDAAVANANKALLKANVSNDKVTEIFALIDAAIAACAKEAFAEAQAKLDAATAEIKASAKQ